jgi:tRNA-specific 2-thiouridylase
MNQIAALLSGGVDSSVAVHLLCEQGYKPDLFYIKIGMEDRGYLDCPQEEDLEIVMAMAHRYGLKYEVVDLQKEYWDNVVAYTIDKVKRGLTPNPDVMCNKLIKFGCFEQRVGHLYDKTATGHYATTVEQDGKVWLGTTPDPVKDQTDFLAQIDYLQVSHLMFPIGTYMKEEVRRIAEAAKLPSAHRKDSQGICFLGKIDYNQFIEKYLGRREGPIVELETGRILGHHQGFWFHTIGQRKGLGLSGGPWFVCRKDIEENVIYVSKGYNPEAQLMRDFTMQGFHFITEQPWSDAAVTAGVEVRFKIRHVPELTHGRLVREANDCWHLYSDDKINGVAPGQFCVIYSPDGRLCYGSGEIAL